MTVRVASMSQSSFQAPYPASMMPPQETRREDHPPRREQLTQVRYHIGTVMPNGQKYEDWLKSKDREEDGKYAGSP